MKNKNVVVAVKSDPIEMGVVVDLSDKYLTLRMLTVKRFDNELLYYIVEESRIEKKSLNQIHKCLGALYVLDELFLAVFNEFLKKWDLKNSYNYSDWIISLSDIISWSDDIGEYFSAMLNK